MLILGLALLVAVIGVAAFPCWPHSRKLGYGPSLAAGSLLVAAAVLAVAHKADSFPTEGRAAVASTSTAAVQPAN